MPTLDQAQATPSSSLNAQTTANFASQSTQSGVMTAQQLSGQAAAKGLGTTTNSQGSSNGLSYNQAYSSQMAPIDAQIAKMQSYQGTAAFDPAQFAALQKQRAALNTQAWQSLQNDGSPGATALAAAINSGKLTWAQVGANIDISQVNNDQELAQSVTNLINQYNPTQSTPSAATPVQNQTAQDEAAAANQIASDLTSASSLASFMNSQSSASLTQADQAQQATLGGIASVGNQLAASSGGANAAREVAGAATNATQQYSTQRAILQTQNQNAVESYINQVFSNDLTNNQALANMSTQDKLNVQSQAADALSTAIQNSIGQADNASQAQLNQLNQAIAAWKTAEQGSEQQASLWGSIVSIGGGLLSAGAGAAMMATGVGAPIGGALVAGGIGQAVQGAAKA